MNIELSAKEFRNLLDILHIAEVVMFGHRRHDDQRTLPHRELIQKLYALAKGEGLDGLVGYKEDIHAHVPTAEFEENSLAHILINEFGDHLFWDELIGRLSVRDAALMAGGIEKLNAMSDDARQTVEEPVRQRYIGEFSKNGVSNLEIVERFGNGRGFPVKTSD